MPEGRVLWVCLLLNFLKIKSKNNVTPSSGKKWLRVVKKSVAIAGRIAGILMVAPFKLPGKIVSLAQYLAMFAGIVKATENNEQQRD
ncbi:hypothetical protein [Pedobacter sp. Leaf132]|uniref:hypothetical protein n=1 Tax=Pedobacter sp. Leaf132 TaxID=2876557 RepID=UPI001E39A1B4|nr:hypothetical protein [Pedobacter sp. Leaf132]